jgi:hypothetical protein
MPVTRKITITTTTIIIIIIIIIIKKIIKCIKILLFWDVVTHLPDYMAVASQKTRTVIVILFTVRTFKCHAQVFLHHKEICIHNGEQ